MSGTEIQDTAALLACQVCGVAMTLNPRGRQRLTCSARCRHEKSRRAHGVGPQRPAAQQHGTRTCYNGGCRCDLCREAENTYRRVRYAQRAASEQGESRG